MELAILHSLQREKLFLAAQFAALEAAAAAKSFAESQSHFRAFQEARAARKVVARRWDGLLKLRREFAQ